jgi:hypothetical protein
MFATQSWLYPDMYLISPFHVASVYSEFQHHKSFVIERKELVSVPHDYPIKATNYYSVYSGVYIGDHDTAWYLRRSKSWRLTDLQAAHPTHPICTLGWSRSLKAWVAFKNPCPTTKTRRVFAIGAPKYPDTYSSGLIKNLDEAHASAVRYAIDVNSRPPSELPEVELPVPQLFIPLPPATLQEQANATINERHETKG